MIVPTNKLLLITGVILLPLAYLLYAMPSLMPFLSTIISSIVIITGIDASISVLRKRNITIDANCLIKLSVGRTSNIKIVIHQNFFSIKTITLGIALPREIHAPNVMTILLTKENLLSSIEWPITALKTGVYAISVCFYEIVSPLSLWAARGNQSISILIHVYPNLLSENKDLNGILFNRRMGAHRYQQIGKGREFEQLRDYLPGDYYEDIHWKASARKGKPITKVFQVERNQEVYIVIDASRLSARTNYQKRLSKTNHSEISNIEFSILDRFVIATLVMGLIIEQQGDFFGIITFSNSIRHFIRAKNGKSHYSACREALFTLQPERVTPDYNELFSFISNRLRQRSHIILLTSLDDPVLSEAFIEKIHLISHKHLVMANMIKPQEANPLFSSPDVSMVEDIYKKLAGHQLWESLKETGKRLNAHGIGFSMIDNQKLSPTLVSQYIEVKQRQLI